ncbi:MAG: hypothetical protein WBN66_03550 [Smithella sp.]
MANVKIGKLTIKSDSVCWTIYETVTAGEDAKNPGEEYDRGIGHYPSLSTCLEAILERDLQGSDASSIAELLSEIRALKKEIRNIKS